MSCLAVAVGLFYERQALEKLPARSELIKRNLLSALWVCGGILNLFPLTIASCLIPLSLYIYHISLGKLFEIKQFAQN